MRTGQFGRLTITDDGDVFNNVTNKPLSLFSDAKGNPVFRSPDLHSNYRVDYIVAMLFLNNGELITDIKNYYVRHKDDNPKNCRVDNLELITDPEEVSDIRFSYLRTGTGGRNSYSPRAVFPLYVADKRTCGIEMYSVSEFSKKFGISESCAVRKAKNCDRIYRDNFYLYVCETMLDAWECL